MMDETDVDIYRALCFITHAFIIVIIQLYFNKSKDRDVIDMKNKLYSIVNYN